MFNRMFAGQVLLTHLLLCIQDGQVVLRAPSKQALKELRIWARKWFYRFISLVNMSLLGGFWRVWKPTVEISFLLGKEWFRWFRGAINSGFFVCQKLQILWRMQWESWRAWLIIAAWQEQRNSGVVNLMLGFLVNLYQRNQQWSIRYCKLVDHVC